MAQSLPLPYRGTMGLSQTNDMRLTQLQLHARRPVLRGPLYDLAHRAAQADAILNGDTIEANFNRNIGRMLDVLEATR